MARGARAATTKYGEDVEHLWGVTRRRQAVHQAVLALRYGFNAEMYYRYRLYALDDPRDAALFFPIGPGRFIRSRLHQRLGCDLSLDDKRAFAARCREIGLPTVPFVAEFDEGDVTWGDAADDAPDRLPARDLFGKPAASEGGDGAQRWRWDGTGYVGEDGSRLAPADLVARYTELSRERPYVLQPRLENAPAMAALSSGALCTVRVMTSSRPGHDPEHVQTVVRMPTGDGPVDNFDAGGLAAPVDPTTGTLGPAVRKDLRLAARDYSVHTATGNRIEGVEVPEWPTILDLALRAHREFDVPIIGWDVAVTTDGILFLEANSSPCVRVGQQPGTRPLGKTSFVATYLAGLG